MDCDLLNMDIGSCTDKSYKGFNRIGWWTLLSNVDLLTMDDEDGKVKFHLKQGQFYEIFDGSTMPFSGTNPNVTVTGTHGFKQYNDRVQFPLKQLAPHSSALMYNLSKGIPVVIILEQTDGGEGRFPVYGLPAGLYAHPDMSFELNEERCWEIVLQSFNTGFPQRFLFDTDVATTLEMKKLLTDYEFIGGITIETGGVVYLAIQNALDSYVYLPDGSKLTTGETMTINLNPYTGVSGSMTIASPKSFEENARYIIDSSTFAGEFVLTSNPYTLHGDGLFAITKIIANNIEGEISANWAQALQYIEARKAIGVTCNDSEFVDEIIAPNAWFIVASGCNLSANAIAVILANARAKTGTYAIKRIDVSGGSNIGIGDWSSQAVSDKNYLVANGWTVLYNI